MLDVEGFARHHVSGVAGYKMLDTGFGMLILVDLLWT